MAGVTQVASTVTETRVTAHRDCVVTATMSTSSRRVAPSARPSAMWTYLSAASTETRRPGVTRHSSSRSTATHQRVRAARHVRPTTLDHQVRQCFMTHALSTAVVGCIDQ